MDNESIIKRFDEMEAEVDRLIRAYEAVKKEKIELTEKIARLEQALQEKTEAVMQHTREKDVVRSRIDGLLAKLGAHPDDALTDSSDFG